MQKLNNTVRIERLKRLLRLLIHFCYYFFVLVPVDIFARILARPTRRLVVLCYHGVCDDQKTAFAWQMATLRRAGCPIALDKPLPTQGKLLIGITFDDGFANLIINAIPILETLDMPSTLFITSGHLGSTPTWSTSPDWAYKQERLLTVTELKSLKRPLITIGSHSVSHPSLDKLPTEAARQEIVESKKNLEELFDKAVDLFAFPYGAYNKTLVKLVQQAGYRHAFTCFPQYESPAGYPFLIGRFEADADDWKVEFWLKIRGAYTWLAPLIILKETVAQSLHIKT